MLGANYNHAIVRKIVIGFGKLFNDISVIRKVGAGEIQRIKVPLTYGAKEHFFVREVEDPKLDRKVAVTFPRVGFCVKTFQFDPSRMLNRKNQLTAPGLSGTTRRAQFAPVPWNIGIELYVMIDNTEDGLQIIEQILPFFGPEFSLAIKTIPDLGVVDDVPIVLNSCVPMDNYATPIPQRRMLDWTMNFTAKAFLYGPIREAKIIRKAQVDTHVPPTGDGTVNADDIANTQRDIRVTVTPDPIDALPEDDFGFTTLVEDFYDGKVYDPETDTDVDPV